MFRIIRYIIIFILIMLGLFFLHKNSAWFKDKIEYTKLFFYSIKGDTQKTPDYIFNQINKQNFIGYLGVATKTKEIKSVKTESIKNTQSTVKISIDGIIYYTNIERKKAGLNPLIKSVKLNKSSSLKTDDMFSEQYFEHMSPDGKTVADLVKSVDYNFQIVGENLALGIFDTDKTLVQAWMDSPTHKENILNPKYTEIGVAVGIADYKGQKQWIAVQHFAKPLPMCQEIDSVVQEKINTEKNDLELEERELQKMAGVIESSPSVDKEYLNEYNLKVAVYNDRLNKLREIISEFNKTIIEYNACVKK